MRNDEAVLLREIMLAVSAIRRPDGSPVCVLWRQHCGVFLAMTGKHPTRIGIEGQADIGGVLCNGRAVQVEVKSPIGRLREGQVRWATMCQSMGVLYVLARSVEDVTGAIREALA